MNLVDMPIFESDVEEDIDNIQPTRRPKRFRRR